MSLLISNLSYKRKNDKNLLSNINLKVDNGDLLIIQGESGCGKTTLLNIISGLVQPSQGLIKLNNISLNSLEQSVASEERKIGYVFQDYALFPHLTAFKNAVYAYKNNSDELTDEYVLNALNLTTHRNKYPHELSGGEQQRIAIARALLNNPELILADEPTGNLDPGTSAEIMEVLKKINSNGTTILIATHDYEIISKFPAKTLRIEGGKFYQLKEKNT